MYFSSWWMPAALCFLLLVAFTITALPHNRLFTILSNVLFVFFAIAFFGILCASVWNLIKKRWAKGIINLFMLPACGVVAFYATSFLIFASMFGPSEDGFADNLTIPKDVDVAKPLNELDAATGKADDAFQQSILAALSIPGNDNPTITADVAILLELHHQSPKVLMRFLATSPSWRVFKEQGDVFATRRWMIGSEWRYALHGYYTRHNIDTWSMAGIPNFQFRFTIGFSGKPWARVSGDATQLDAGQTRSLLLSTGNQMHESRCIIISEDLVVEVFEQSEAKERRLTKAALSHVEMELSPLVKQPDWKAIRRILPAESIKQGGPAFELRNSFQPGIYDSEIWVNPGEPGMLYLKAFEITQKTPLSVDRLKDKSNEWIGWSDNPKELFFSNTHFTIYEGDWGKPYAARFEVWFTPDTGAKDRKLMEKVFEIEGWQR